MTSVGSLRLALLTLSDDQFARLANRIVGTRDTLQEVNPVACLRMAFFEWLMHLGCLTESQCNAILNIVQVNKQARFTLVDQRYAHIASNPEPGKEWFDIVTEDFLSAPPRIVTMVVCDFEGLKSQIDERLSRGQKHGDSDQRPSCRSVDISRDVRVSAPGTGS